MSVATPGPRPGTRAAYAEELVQLMPALGRRLQSSLPPDIREQIHSVTPHQMEVVGNLAAEPGGLSMNDLARAQGCALSTATAMADRLIKQGLVDRVADPADRRVVRLVPTPQAIDLRNRFRAAKRQAALAAIQSLEVDEMASLVRLLRKIAEGKEGERG